MEQRTNIVKVSWSGGKDSTCACDLHIVRGDKVVAVCYIPMFTETIPLLLKDHHEFILQTAERFRREGATVHIVSGMTYYDYVHKRSSRGKFKGRAFGFPCFKVGQCGFKRDSKLKALHNIDIGSYDYEDIGIAFDEKHRQRFLSESKRSILFDYKMTERNAFKYCEARGLLSPHYDLIKRDGCTLCPHATSRARAMWFEQYPEALPIVHELQEFVKVERPDQTPLRNYTWFIDGEGVIH